MTNDKFDKYNLEQEDLEKIDKVFSRLHKYLVNIPEEPTTSEIRKIVSKISQNKNKLFVFKNTYTQKLKKLQRNLILLKRQSKLLEAQLIESDKFKLRHFGANERAKIISYRVSIKLEDISKIEADYKFLESFLSCIDSTLSELNNTFNMVSRILSTMQMDLNIGEN